MCQLLLMIIKEKATDEFELKKKEICIQTKTILYGIFLFNARNLKS